MEKVRGILNNAEPGDALRVIALKDGEISNCQIMFLSNGAEVSKDGTAVKPNKVNGLGSVSGVSRWSAAVFGEVVEVLDGFIKIECSPGEYEYVKNDTKCMRFTYQNNRTKLENNLEPQEIVKGDKVLYLAQNYAMRVLCIYEHPELQ